MNELFFQRVLITHSELIKLIAFMLEWTLLEMSRLRHIYSIVGQDKQVLACYKLIPPEYDLASVLVERETFRDFYLNKVLMITQNNCSKEIINVLIETVLISYALTPFVLPVFFLSSFLELAKISLQNHVWRRTVAVCLFL